MFDFHLWITKVKKCTKKCINGFYGEDDNFCTITCTVYDDENILWNPTVISFYPPPSTHTHTHTQRRLLHGSKMESKFSFLCRYSTRYIDGLETERKSGKAVFRVNPNYLSLLWTAATSSRDLKYKTRGDLLWVSLCRRVIKVCVCVYGGGVMQNAKEGANLQTCLLFSVSDLHWVSTCH